MSEESCAEGDDDKIHKHTMVFRSEGNVLSSYWLLYICFCVRLALNELISKLDKRGAKKEAMKCGFKNKVRVVKSPSKLPCPSEAPKWAVAQPDEATTSGSFIASITDSTPNSQCDTSNSDSCDSDSD